MIGTNKFSDKQMNLLLFVDKQFVQRENNYFKQKDN